MRQIVFIFIFFHIKSVYSDNDPTYLRVTPTFITDFDARDGRDLTIIGNGFSSGAVSDVLCYFEGILNKTVQALALNDTAITCRLSNYTNVTIARIFVSLDNGTNWLNTTYNIPVHIVITPDCSHNGCLYGRCSFGNCICLDGHEGEACDQCADGYFRNIYGSCSDCSIFCMNNGTCTNQTCVCREEFRGILCNNCFDHHYGDNCSVIPVLLSANPNMITAKQARDGIDIILRVDYVNVSSAICRFQALSNWTIRGSFINNTAILCRLANYTDSYSMIEIKLFLNNGTTPTFGVSYIFVNSLCSCVYGQCQNDSCRCYDGYVGETCDQCADGYFRNIYGSCSDCSIFCMNNGTCTNQTCVCRERFTGTFCDTCAEHHYGENCSVIPVLLSVNPNTITDYEARDGIDIHITVDNFVGINSSMLVCRFRVFDEQIVKAILVNETTILCTLSNFTTIYTIDVSVSLDNGSSWIDDAYWYSGRIDVRLDCGNNTCIHGYCSFGTCVCNAGFNGSSCDRCKDGYFISPYGSCLKCSDYCNRNGECRNQTCVCANRFTGLRCSTCIDHHYGSNCTQYPIVLSVSPNWITDTASRDGINITITGDHLNFTDISQVLCRFQSTSNRIVQALEVSTTMIICYLSNHNDLTSIQLSVSLDNGTNWLLSEYSYYYSRIFIYSDCADNPCLYGRCSYGKCLCRSNSNYLEVSPTNGPIYGGYPLTFYGICFNDSSYIVHINNQPINDCQLDGVALICTMPMTDEGRLEIQVYNTTGLISRTSFRAFLPDDDTSTILTNDLELGNRIWSDNDTDEITLHFQTNYMTVNYLCQITVYDYSTPIGDGNQTETTVNFSRRRLDLGLGLLNLSDIRNFTISRDSFFSKNSSTSTFHSLGIKFEIVESENRRRALPAVIVTVYEVVDFVQDLADAYCLGWRSRQSDENTRKLVNEVPPCPRRVATTWPQQALGFTADEACDARKSGFWNCRFQPGATGCYRAQSATSNAGAQCCYDSTGNWIQSGPGAGTIYAISPEKSEFLHFMDDVLPFFACCYSKIIFGIECEDYTKYRPPGNSVDRTIVLTGGGGDPHFSILNGKSYTFNGHGEYVLLKVSTIELEIQVRLAAMTNDSLSTGDTATAIIAFVVQLINQSRVQFDLISHSKTVDIRVDGRLLESTSNLSPVIFSDEHQLTIRRETSTKYHISYGQTGVDIDVNIRPEFDFLDLPILIPRPVLESATCQGLLGDLQGLTFPNGTSVSTEALGDEELMFEYGESWRTTDSSTLFTYALFDNHAQRQDFNYKPIFRADLFNRYNNTDEYRTAEEKCQNLTKRDDCMYDILIMKDPTVADAQKTFEENQKTWIIYNQIVEAAINSTTSTPSTSQSTSIITQTESSSSTTLTSSTTSTTQTISSSAAPTSSQLSSSVSSTFDTSSTTSSVQPSLSTSETTTRGVLIELTPISDYCK